MLPICAKGNLRFGPGGIPAPLPPPLPLALPPATALRHSTQSASSSTEGTSYFSLLQAVKGQPKGSFWPWRVTARTEKRF